MAASKQHTGARNKTTRASARAAYVWSQRGSALLVVLGIVAAILFVGSALFIMGGTEADLVDRSVDASQALYLAEAGVERARAWLWELASLDPPIEPPTGLFQDQALGGGEYDVTVTKLAGGPPTQYEILATGTADNDVRQVRTVVEAQAGVGYLFMSHEDDAKFWFITGDTLDGPIHCNKTIQIDGDAWFWDKVSTKENNIDIKSGNPMFVMGYEVSVPEVTLPNKDVVNNGLTALAQAGGIYGAQLSGGDARYEVQFGRDDSLGYMSYRTYEDDGGYTWSDWIDVDLSTINGVVSFDDDVWVEGTVDGRVTLNSKDNMFIVDDIVYADATPTDGPNPGCNDLLGLVAKSEIFIPDNTPNLTDCVIHAAILATDKNLVVVRFNKDAPRGDLVVHGAIIQKEPKPTGEYLDDGTVVHGYRKVFRYDDRLRSEAPPHFPWITPGAYTVCSWDDQIPLTP